MDSNKPHTDGLLSEIESLKNQLFEARSMIEAIREGEVDALVINKDGKAGVYTLESADYAYRILIENFAEGALTLSDEGLILYCNDYFSKLVGISADRIIGTYFNPYLCNPEAFEQLKANLNRGESSKGEILLNGDGVELHVSISLTDLHPSVSALGVIVTDLTEKRKHEEALLKYQQKLELKVEELNLANASLEQFIHVISHDIKEPLRKILMYTSHISSDKPELFSEKELRNLGVINSSALRLNSLVDDLVTYAFSANKVQDVKVNLDKVLREVLEDLELLIDENKAEITFTHLPSVSGSKVQMRQLLSNLISNSIKYSKKDKAPKINITATITSDVDVLLAEGKFYVISIEDNGIGMETANLGKIFTIFQRLHLRNEYSGNGIGLAICKKIMENHNGKIEVESTIGAGSIFRLYFPINGEQDEI
jgi:PAS domain S-box-containing protein